MLVGCRRRGPEIRIEVFDTGVGIPPEQLSKVFNAFHRVESSGSDGLGVGLFVVRRAVDLLGHRVEVRSAVGRGSWFTIRAPSAAVNFEPRADATHQLRDGTTSDNPNL